MNNFNLKEYLVENKITTNSQMVNEINNTTLTEMAKVIAKYYTDIDTDIQEMQIDDLVDSLEKYIINDADIKDNQAFQTAYNQLINQPFKVAFKNFYKILNLAEKIQLKNQ
jgi:hypothetical protein